MSEQYKASPRPWRVNPAWPSGSLGPDPSAILDANGKDVLPVSEWMTAKASDIALIVTAVNLLHELEKVINPVFTDNPK